MQKLKAFIKSHKGLVIGAVVVAGVVYLLCRRTKVDNGQAIMLIRKILPGEDALEVAKSLMGPETILKSTPGLFGTLQEFVNPGKEFVQAFIIDHFVRM